MDSTKLNNLGNLGSSILGAIGSGINAWNNVNQLTGVDEAYNNLFAIGNQTYGAGNYDSLMLLRLATANIPLNYDGTDFYNPSKTERFGLLASSAIDGYMSGRNVGNATSAFAWGGDLGGMIGGISNNIINAISNSVLSKRAERLANFINSQAGAARMVNDNRFANAVSDTGRMYLDGLMLNRRDFGGPMGYYWGTFDNGFRIINEGGTHELNPYLGVQLGIAPDGRPNLVEEGEAIFNDYVYSNRLKLSKADAKEFGLGGIMTFADAAKKLARESEERPNDPISKRGLEHSMELLKQKLEELKLKKELLKLENLMALLSPSDLMMMQQEQLQMPEQLNMTQEMVDPTMMLLPMGFAEGGHLFEDGGASLTLELLLGLLEKYGDVIFEMLQSQYPELLQLLGTNPENTKAALLYLKTQDNEDFINQHIAAIIENSAKTMDTRKYSLPTFIAYNPKSDEKTYRRYLSKSGWTELLINNEIQRATKTKLRLSYNCIGTITHTFYDESKKYLKLLGYTDKEVNQFIKKNNIFATSVAYFCGKTTYGSGPFRNKNVGWSFYRFPGNTWINPKTGEPYSLRGDIISYIENSGTSGHSNMVSEPSTSSDKSPLVSYSNGYTDPGAVGLKSTEASKKIGMRHRVTDVRAADRDNSTPYSYGARFKGTPGMREAINSKFDDLDLILAEALGLQVVYDPYEKTYKLIGTTTPKIPEAKKDATVVATNEEEPVVKEESTIPAIVKPILGTDQNESVIAPAEADGVPAAVADSSFIGPLFGPEAVKKELLDNSNAAEVEEAALILAALELAKLLSAEEDNSLPISLRPKYIRANGGHLFEDAGPLTFEINNSLWLDKLPEGYTGRYIYDRGQYYLLPTDFNQHGNYSNIKWNKNKNYWEMVQAPLVINPEGEGPKEYPTNPFANGMRTMPVLGSLMQSISTATRKPNYQHQNAAIHAAASLPSASPSYIPSETVRMLRFDAGRLALNIRDIYAQAIASGLNSGLSRAALLTQNYNLLGALQKALGENYIQGLAYNNTAEKEAAALRLQTLILNATMGMQAQGVNIDNARTYALMVAALEALKQAIDDTLYTNRMNTLSNALTQAGSYGNDLWARNERDWLLSTGYAPGWEYRGMPQVKTSAEGGKLKYKSRRRK